MNVTEKYLDPQRIHRSGRNLSLRWRDLLVGLLVTACALAVPEARADFAYTWGQNNDGQLGDSTTTARSTPAPVTGLTSGVTSVAGGGVHSLAVQNGGVYAWGHNAEGALGDGTTTDGTTPVAVTGLTSGVTAIAGGDDHSLALKNGGVYAWGNNSIGQIGDGTFNNIRTTPVTVTGLASGVTAVAAGTQYNLALKNGGIYAWGNNINGQLGDGTNEDYRTAPVAVIGMTSGVTAIAAGYDLSLAVRNGGAYAWGYNGLGELGNGTTTNSSTPIAVTGLSSGVTSMAAGEYHSLALKNGGVYAWGNNNHGQLGDGTASPQLTPEQIDPADLHNIIEVDAGAASSYALSSDGSLWVWGDNFAGQLGLGTENDDYLTPQHLLPPSGYTFTSIDAFGFGSHVVATLAAVPEPATFVLAALGIAGLAAWGWRQRATRQATASHIVAAFAGTVALCIIPCTARGQVFVTFQAGSSIGEYTTSGVTVNSALINAGGADIAVSGSNLFITSGGAIREYTTSGALVNASLVSGLSSAYGIAVSGSNLFVVNNQSGTIGKYTTSGAVVNAALVTGLGSPTFIAVSGSNLFVVDRNTDAIGEYDAITGATINASLIKNLGTPYGVAVSGSNLFVAGDGDGTLYGGRIDEYTTSGAVVKGALIAGLGAPNGIAISGSNLYVANSFDSYNGTYSFGSIGEYTTSGATVNAALVSGLTNNPFGIAVVPEPSTFVLAALGFLGLLTCIRKWRGRSPFSLNRQKAPANWGNGDCMRCSCDRD